jgi:hypothetical protein
MKVTGQLHAPAALPPGKGTRYLLGRRVGGPQSRSRICVVEKNLAPVRNRTPIVQLVAHPCTD